jgi:DNA-directed RNA polymerase
VNSADRAIQYVTAFLLDDVDAQQILLSETTDPEMVSALATVAGGFLKRMAEKQDVTAEELWSRTLYLHADHLS